MVSQFTIVCTGDVPGSLLTTFVIPTRDPCSRVTSSVVQGPFQSFLSTDGGSLDSLTTSFPTLSVPLQDRPVHQLGHFLAKISVAPPFPLITFKGTHRCLRVRLARREEEFMALGERFLAREVRVASLTFAVQYLLQQN